jgi:AraC-like DNA-binding protein
VKDFFKYITIGKEDQDWGIYLNVVGKSRISAYAEYPSKEHPTGYYFDWKSGRKLNEYQLNYITEGAGILETKSGRILIKPGSMMIIRPGIWHRYKPVNSTGWLENYVGFNGSLVSRFIERLATPPDQPVVFCTIHEEFIETYNTIFDIVLGEKPGFNQVASGMVVKLLGQIVSSQKQRYFFGNKIEKIVQEARVLMQENLEEKVDLQLLASRNNMGYSYLRKMFKRYTGLAPHQYLLELKLLRAKELLRTTEKSIKEISYELGFQSIHYFSRLFKTKVGINPSEMRG